MAGTIDFCYQNQTYVFSWNFQPGIIKSGKALYVGSFLDKAPGNLEIGKPYLLKQLTVKNPTEESCAASRICYDLLPMEGENLRKLLLVDDPGRVVQQALMKGKYFEKTVCMTLEAWHGSLAKYFKDCHKMPVAKRLQILRQMTLGSLQLSSNANKINDRRIVAHRDIKLHNGVEDATSDEFRVLMVDFDTVCLQQDIPTGTKRRVGTMPYPLSPQNSCPEMLLEEYPVSDKCDLYGLGMMLASLFMKDSTGYVNPCAIFSDKTGFHEGNPVNTMKAALEACKKLPNTAQKTWIEAYLEREHGIRLTWENLQDPAMETEIRTLVKDCIYIDPNLRISRQELLARLDRLIAMAMGEVPSKRVAVYLLDIRSKHMDRLAKMAEAAMLEDLDEDMAVQLVTVGSHEEGKEIRASVQAISDTPFTDAVSLGHSIRALPEAVSGKSLLLQGVYIAGQWLKQHEKAYRFSGVVRIFADSAPDVAELSPFWYNGKNYDFGEVLEATFGTLGGYDGADVLCHCLFPSPAYREIIPCDVRQCEATLQQTPEPEVTPEPEAKPEPPVVKDKYDVSPTGLYVALPNGEYLYINAIG